MRLALGLAAALAAFGLAPANAQDGDERVRLDDFALPAAEQGLPVEQVDTQAASLPARAEVPDRTILAPPQGEAAPVAPDQLSRKGADEAPAQISSPADSRKGPLASVSSTTDSTPGATVRLKGVDRCDPQLARPEYERCLHILELRADEFHAPAPPRLSAEETLLAEQRAREERSAGGSIDARLRMASSVNPDADLASNQELASLFLDDGAAAAQQQPKPTDTPEPSADLVTALQAIGVPLTTDPGGN